MILSGEYFFKMEHTSKRGRKAADTEPATKRIAQVRTAARAYRERKEAHVANLEATVKAFQNGTQPEMNALSQRVKELELENSLLKQMAFALVPAMPISPPAIPFANHITPSATEDLFAWSNQLALDQASTLTDALFSNVPTPLVRMESFRQSHSGIPVDPTLDADLEALLNAPLPTISLAHDTEVVKGYLAKAKNAILSITAVSKEQALVDELFQYYTNFILDGTDVIDPRFCRVNFAKIYVFQGRLLEKCTENVQESADSMQDIGRLMNVFEAIKSEFAVWDSFEGYVGATPNKA
ncbi:hypothetical protein HDU98_011798 [Podochytrium sp. JEL0797]|nr:hypothetical protein HDU98_011798 [Podochytrium sp. JEL0797]